MDIKDGLIQSSMVQEQNYRPEFALLIYLLKHASKVYTATLFRDFKEEFRIAISCSISKVTLVRGLKMSKYKNI